jgi:recombination protein RecA
MELYHDHGLDYEADVLKLGVEEEVIAKSGAFLSYGDTRLGQGKDNARAFLRDNPAVRDAIVAEVLAKKLPAEALPGPAIDAAAEETELEPAEAPAPKKRGKAAAE